MILNARWMHESSAEMEEPEPDTDNSHKDIKKDTPVLPMKSQANMSVLDAHNKSSRYIYAVHTLTG